MNYEELGKLIDDRKEDEIREGLTGMSEQELGLLLTMITPEQAAYVNYLSAFDNAPESFLDEDEMNDWILSNFSGELPTHGDEEAWNKFYAYGSPFIMYETALTDKLSPRIKSDNSEDATIASSPVYVHEKVKEEDYPEILSIFEKYGYGKNEMDGWLNSKLTDVGDQFAELDGYIGSEPDTEDVNSDGDTDVVTADTNGNGEKDTAVVTADSEPEKKEAIKAAKEDLGLDKEDKTSTGKTKGELEDEPKENDVVSDEKKKDMTCSDATQKNIMAALLDHRF